MRFENPAIGGIGAEQLGDLLHQALHHRREAKVARHHLRRFQKGALAVDPLSFLSEQSGRVNREPSLPGNGLGKRDLALGPAADLGAVEGKHADHVVEDEDWRGEHGLRSELDQRFPAAKAGVVKLDSRLDVGDRDRAPLSRREVRRRQARRRTADGIVTGGRPLGVDLHLAAGLGEANEAPGDLERPSGFSHRNCQHIVEVELGADLARDRGNKTLALERGLERLGGPAAAERQRRLVREPLEELELARREETTLGEDRHDQDAREPAFGDQGQEGCALRRHRVEGTAHMRCSLDVVHGKRGPLARNGRDPARILDEIDLDPLPPILIGAPGRKPRRKALFVVHDGEHRRLDPERMLQLVEQVLGLRPSR